MFAIPQLAHKSLLRSYQISFRTFPSIYARKFSHHTPPNLNYTSPPPPEPLTSVEPKSRFGSRKLLAACLIFGTGVYAYKKFYPNRYPSSVAQLLKDGLWATINGGGSRRPDYQKSLTTYLNALKEADAMGMPHSSSEYTGIQIVIADLYEQLGLLSEATSMYVEIANAYLLALTQNTPPPQMRAEIITRDLRITLIAATLMASKPNGFKIAVDFVAPHLIMATREALKKSGELVEMLHNKAPLDLTLFKDIQDGRLPDTIFTEVFGGYQTELVALRDLMTGIYASVGEYSKAGKIKQKTTEIMLTSGFSKGECIFSALNVATLLFLEAADIKQKSIEQANKTKLPQPTKPALTNNEVEETDDLEAYKQEIQKLADKHNQQHNQSHASDASSTSNTVSDDDKLAQASEIFTQIVETVNKTSQKRDPFITESLVFALYGQGVLASSTGKWDLALDKLKEARLRARGCKLTSVLHQIDSEVQKVEKLSQMSPEEITKSGLPNIQFLDVMFWRDANPSKPKIQVERS